MAMTNRYCESVRRIVGFDVFLQRQQPLHHPLHLYFVGSASSSHCFFDLRRRIFLPRQVLLRDSQQNNANSTADRQSGRFVLVKKQPLRRYRIRLISVNQLKCLLIYFLNAGRGLNTCLGRNDAVRNCDELTPGCFLHHAVACRCRSRVKG